jgi:formylglycine-generating enzyme required for sulfatase activity
MSMRCTFILFSVGARRTVWQAAIALALFSTTIVQAAETPTVVDADARTEAEMKPYREPIPGDGVAFDMVPIPGGRFTMGSPASEASRKEDEGPPHEVQVAPFWMGKCEVTWDEYQIFMFSLDIARRKSENREPTPNDLLADAVARPTKPYTDMTFGMGKEGFPAICMTQLAAKKYCEWISAKTGRYYRLPTEAEWEYACRAGTTTAYSFGDDPAALGDYAWYYDNCEEKYQKVGLKKPNPWGLHDMHGNVREWCLDQYLPEAYGARQGLSLGPLEQPTKLEPRSVRGGSWEDDPDRLRSAARIGSDRSWKQQDPQIPQSIWYYTDAQFLGFRVLRPLQPPTPEEQARFGPDPFQQ